MKIDIIYIACFKHDIRYTRMLVASIRHWYPQIPISLIKDKMYGDFNTAEIERVWNVGVLATERRIFGWGLSKLEPLFLDEGQRCLILDSDIVFVGKVLASLEEYNEDFVVQLENPKAEFVRSNYFNLDGLHKLDPEFRFPGFTFNTGQFVATTGLLNRADFDAFVEWNEPPLIKHPEVFKYGEQGLLNYILMKKHQQAALTLRRAFFMRIPNCDDCPAIDLERLNDDSPYALVLHWGGLKQPEIRKMSRGEVLLFFERQYYRCLRFGWMKQSARHLGGVLGGVLHTLTRRMPRITRYVKSVLRN